MKRFVKFSPLFFSFGCLSQTPSEKINPRVEFGFSTSTFFGISAANPVFMKKSGQESGSPKISYMLTPSSNFGWKQGLFYWVNLNDYLAYKAQFDIVYSVNSYATLKNTTCYSTATGFELKPQLVIRPLEVDRAPMVKLAKSMSYYLSGKQPYLIIGPKFGFYKSDKNFRKENNTQYYTIGCVAGFGNDNMFHNMDFAPEVTMSVEYQTGNSHIFPKATNRYFVSASVGINFF